MGVIKSVYKYSHPVTNQFCNFWHPATLTLRSECQSARISKITNDSLTRSGTGCIIAVTTVGVKGLMSYAGRNEWCVVCRTSSPDVSDRSDGLTVPRPVSPGMTARELFKNVVQYIKCDLTEMRETAIIAFGHANELALRYHLASTISWIEHLESQLAIFRLNTNYRLEL